jgi:hypothetical protein
VIREIAKLKELNLIAVEHQVNEKGEYSSNRYILLDLTPHSSEKEVVSGRDQGSITRIPPVVSHRYQGSRSLRPKQHPENKTKKEQDTEEQPVVVALIDQGISERVAQRLAKSYSKAHVEEKIAYLAISRQSARKASSSPVDGSGRPLKRTTQHLMGINPLKNRRLRSLRRSRSLKNCYNKRK